MYIAQKLAATDSFTRHAAASTHRQLEYWATTPQLSADAAVNAKLPRSVRSRPTRSQQ